MEEINIADVSDSENEDISESLKPSTSHYNDYNEDKASTTAVAGSLAASTTAIYTAEIMKPSSSTTESAKTAEVELGTGSTLSSPLIVPIVGVIAETRASTNPTSQPLTCDDSLLSSPSTSTYIPINRMQPLESIVSTDMIKTPSKTLNVNDVLAISAAIMEAAYSLSMQKVATNDKPTTSTINPIQTSLLNTDDDRTKLNATLMNPKEVTLVNDAIKVKTIAAKIVDSEKDCVYKLPNTTTLIDNHLSTNITIDNSEKPISQLDTINEFNNESTTSTSSSTTQSETETEHNSAGQPFTYHTAEYLISLPSQDTITSMATQASTSKAIQNPGDILSENKTKKKKKMNNKSTKASKGKLIQDKEPNLKTFSRIRLMIIESLARMMDGK